MLLLGITATITTRVNRDCCWKMVSSDDHYNSVSCYVLAVAVAVKSEKRIRENMRKPHQYKSLDKDALQVAREANFPNVFFFCWSLCFTF